MRTPQVVNCKRPKITWEAECVNSACSILLGCLERSRRLPTSVDYANKLIMRFYLKGTDFGKINSTILYHKAITYINAWPMEVLGWRTPRQAFLGELVCL
jgi:hypothetical protein